jgi:hypothetical protein
MVAPRERHHLDSEWPSIRREVVAEKFEPMPDRGQGPELSDV